MRLHRSSLRFYIVALASILTLGLFYPENGVGAEAFTIPVTEAPAAGMKGSTQPLPNRNIPPTSSVMDENDELPWVLTADKLVSLDDGVIVEASGDVYLRRGKDSLKADFARLFTATNWVFIQGNVEVDMGQDHIVASEAEFDLTSSTGWLKDGHVFMEGPHIYFTGENVTKHWGDTYTFENAKVTTCDGPSPAWSLSAETAQVEIDGYATLTHSTFQVKDQGVIATPWMILPAKTSRQTGFLLPDAGVSSLHGAYYTQPWFWAWQKDRDVTLYLTWMEKVGVMPSVRYRSQPTDRDKTWFAADFLYDDDVFTSESQDPIASHDGKIRTNHARYWLRGMADGEIASSDWFYRMTVDYTSDQNYLREFQNRATGFVNSRDEMLGIFGRDIAEVDRKRVTEGFIYRDWERFRLAVGARYEQDSSLGHGNKGLSTDTTVQKLPQLSAYFFKSRIVPDFPLELEASATTAFLYRRSGTRGMKTEIYPKLSLPVDLKYANLIAEAGVRQTFYHSSRERATSPLRHGGTGGEANIVSSKQFGTTRTIPEFNLTTFTQASRVWDLPAFDPLDVSTENIGKSKWTGIRHIFEPRLKYSWVADVDQKRNPFYTLDDRIQAENSIDLTLTNLFTVRSQKIVPGTDNNGQIDGAALEKSYHELLKVSVGGGFDFEESSRNQHLAYYPRRPMKDIMLDVTFNYNEYVSLWSKSYFSLYGEGVTRSDHGLTLQNPRWGSISSGYSTRSRYHDYLRQVRYDDIEDIRFEEPLNLIRNEVVFKPTKNWMIGGLSAFDLKNGKHYEGRVSLSYVHQCYRLTGNFVSKGKEKSYHFSIELLGLN